MTKLKFLKKSEFFKFLSKIYKKIVKNRLMSGLPGVFVLLSVYPLVDQTETLVGQSFCRLVCLSVCLSSVWLLSVYRTVLVARCFAQVARNNF